MTEEFYDDLAPYYHLLFADWQASIDRQGNWLDAFIRGEWPSASRVLDAAAGIGTQSLALAARGYRVTASDISSAALARARREAEDRGLTLTVERGALRTLSSIGSDFDLVIALDNAVPHLLSDQEILEALRECARCLVPGGGCLFSIRDYAEPRTGSEFHPYGIRTEADARYVLFQVWDWQSGHYDLSLYVVREDERGLETKVFRSRYYAISPQRLMELMEQAGFERVRRVDTGFYQPVLVGTKP